MSAVGAVLAALGAVWAAPVAFALPAAPPVVGAPATAAAAGKAGVGMVSPGTEILTFDTGDVTHAAKAKPVGGLAGDHLVGIDYRPTDHKLYGVGLNGSIYRIDDQSGAAAKIGALSTKLNGSSGGENKGFDIDFTPDGNTLRIVSDRGQNLHQGFGAAGPTGKTVTDGNLSRTGVAAIAYDDGGRIVGIDTPNAEVVTADGKTGKISDLGAKGAFPKMYSVSNGIDIVGGAAFAVVNINHHHTLFSVDAAKGTVNQFGEFPDHVLDLTLKR